MRNSANQYSKLRQRGALVFILQLVKVKISSVKAQRVFSILWGVIHREKKNKPEKKKNPHNHNQNLFTSDRNVRVCKYLRSGNHQCNRSNRKMMLFTWKTVKCLYFQLSKSKEEILASSKVNNLN